MIISRTPLRISFAGGGSDLREFYEQRPGKVVSTAINKHVYIAVNEKFTDNIRVGYSQVEYVEEVHEVQHNLIREALKQTGVDRCVDIVYMSDLLPDHEGSGLGASSSITIGALHALYALKGEYVSAEKLAREASKIEIEVLGHPIGKQDQYAAAYGGLNRIQFNSDESVFVNPLIMKPKIRDALSERLMMFHTGISKRADQTLTEQRRDTKSNLEYITQMTDLAENLTEELREGNINSLGNTLHEGWLLKKRLAQGISNPTIDSHYEKARKAGAIGGKVLGSGGGGFMLFYCEKEKQESVRRALRDLRELKFNFEPEGSKIIYMM